MTDEPPQDGLFGLNVRPQDARVIVIPVPWEATASHGRGAARGPQAIFEASAQVDLFDVGLAAFGCAQPVDAGIHMLEPAEKTLAAAPVASACAQRVIRRYDAGRPVGDDDPDLVCANELSAQLNARVEATARAWRAQGKLVGVLGGDHSVAFGAVAAAAAAHPGLGVLQFDAHADLRVAYQRFEHSHASVMHNVMHNLAGVARLVSVGVRDICAEEADAIAGSEGRMRAFFDADCARRSQAGTPWRVLCEEVAAALPETIYISFDIDGLDPALCPHTGTPVPGGLSFQQAVGVLAALIDAKKKIVGFDLCEVAPGPVPDAAAPASGDAAASRTWDANVGARVLYQLIGHALASAT